MKGKTTMKCPYAVHRQITTQTAFEFDEEGRNNIATTIENNTASFCNCHKENCGAWDSKQGRCNYGGIAE